MTDFEDLLTWRESSTSGDAIAAAVDAAAGTDTAAFDVIARIADTATKTTVLATVTGQLSLFLEEHGLSVVALATEKRRTHRGFEQIYEVAVAGSFV